MASFQNFRSAFNGFNREDVVHYIEFINNKHASEVNQLNNEMSALYQDLETFRVGCEEAVRLAEQLQQEQEKSAAREQQVQSLEQEIEALKQQLEEQKLQMEQNMNMPRTGSELEAYRRAERAERNANDRVRQLYAQANGALADATAKTDETACTISQMADQVCAQLAQLQTALTDGANSIRDTATAMYAINPISMFD